MLNLRTLLSESYLNRICPDEQDQNHLDSAEWLAEGKKDNEDQGKGRVLWEQYRRGYRCGEIIKLWPMSFHLLFADTVKSGQ